MTWNTPRSTITSTRPVASLDLRTLSTRNVIESPASFATAFAFLIALPEMSVATTSKPRFARFIACVAGPVPKSRRLPALRRCAFKARSMSTSRSGLYQGRVATSEVAYSSSQSPVGPVAPGGSTMLRPPRGWAKALCLPPAAGGCAILRAHEILWRIRFGSHRPVQGLEKAPNASVVIDVHGERGGLCYKARHPHDVSREHDEEARAGGWPDPANLQRPARRRAEHALVVAQAELRLCDADWQAVQPGVPETREVLQGRGIVLHVGCAIDRRGDLRDLFLEKILVLVDEPHRLCRTGRRIEDEPCERLPARSPVLMRGVRGRPHAEVLAMVHDGIDLAVRVGDESVHPDHWREAERPQDSHVRIEVHHARREGLRILEAQLLPFGAAMVLQRADADDKDRGVGSESALAAYQIHELLRAEVRSEAGFRDDDVSEAQAEAVRKDRVVPVRDVRERPAMDEGGRPFERLDQVRHERVLQQDCRGAVHVKVSDLHGTLLAVERDDDPLEACLQVRDPFREA